MPDTRHRISVRALAETDRRRSSRLWLLVVSAVVVSLWFVPVQQAELAHRLSLGLWWGTLLAWAFAVRRPRATRVAQALEVAAELAASVAATVTIFASGTLTTPVWLVSFGRAFAWWPRRRPVVLATRWGLVATHLALAGAWALSGRLSGVVVVLALLVGELVVLQVSTQLLGQRLDLEAEGELLHRELEGLILRRDHERIAREVHDGLGAELVALNLSLRNKGPRAKASQDKVLTLLEELRSVVWSLRGGHGSLSEFEKIVRARARARLPSVALSTSLGPGQSAVRVEPEVAFAALAALEELVSAAARSPALTALAIELSGQPRITLRVRLVGVAGDDVARVRDAVAASDLRGALRPTVGVAEAGGGLELAFG